jgi:hypothetical protein
VEIVADRLALTGQHLAAYVRVSRHPALTTRRGPPTRDLRASGIETLDRLVGR